VLLKAVNPSTGALPFQSLRVADLGDVNVNLYNLQDSCRLIQEAYQKIIGVGCVPLTLGNGCLQGRVLFSVLRVYLSWASDFCFSTVKIETVGKKIFFFFFFFCRTGA
jgi:hypothetical protein